MQSKKIIQSFLNSRNFFTFAKAKTDKPLETVSVKKGQISQVIGAVVDVQF